MDVNAIGGDRQHLAEINGSYSIDMNFDSIPGLCHRHNLRFGKTLG